MNPSPFFILCVSLKSVTLKQNSRQTLTLIYTSLRALNCSAPAVSSMSSCIHPNQPIVISGNSILMERSVPQIVDPRVSALSGTLLSKHSVRFRPSPSPVAFQTQTFYRRIVIVQKCPLHEPYCQCRLAYPSGCAHRSDQRMS